MLEIILFKTRKNAFICLSYKLTTLMNSKVQYPTVSNSRFSYNNTTLKTQNLSSPLAVIM